MIKAGLRAEIADCTAEDEIGAYQNEFLEYMEKLLTPPPPSVSLNFTSFSRTVGCMLLASINKNVTFPSALEIKPICTF